MGLIAAFLFNGTFLCGALLFLLRVIPDFERVYCDLFSTSVSCSGEAAGEAAVSVVRVSKESWTFPDNLLIYPPLLKTQKIFPFSITMLIDISIIEEIKGDVKNRRDISCH